jgi:DNA-binding CsgD family transcriptional regulator
MTRDGQARFLVKNLSSQRSCRATAASCSVSLCATSTFTPSGTTTPSGPTKDRAPTKGRHCDPITRIQRVWHAPSPANRPAGRKRLVYDDLGASAVPRRTDCQRLQGINEIGTGDRVGSLGREVVWSVCRSARKPRLSALGLPTRLISTEIRRAHRTVWGYIRLLRRPPAREPARSPLRLSLHERKEILRGVSGGESLRPIARRLDRAPSTVAHQVSRNGRPRCSRACSADRDFGAAADALEAGDMSAVAGGGGSKARVAPVAAADLALAGRRVSPTIASCVRRARRSICRCSCSPGVRCPRNWVVICGPGTRRGVHAGTR